ncbi:Pycsar system effector family protein [Hufsiella ginkgonis]|uniref:Phosphohydrolase n=1 Tax=Hufsiella ginkgonis TaxID=2695274 RepID=A0A7K1Y110_9SPHI|nr:Pycsar system effector family protein [Hufsiella ginkgonis]MXV16797.1 phosphohydrolase [Hufsiella ginkgonis]
MDYTAALAKVKEHVSAFFDSHKNGELDYHNQVHTEAVVEAAAQIANHYQLDGRDFFVVNAAAWFHDIGYYIDFVNHETVGAQEAVKFLASINIDEETAQAVADCVVATSMPQRPGGLLQQIVCDADFYHLGTDHFKENNRNVRKEFGVLWKEKPGKSAWREKTILLLEKHRYFTEYCQLLLNDKKQENLDWLLSRRKTEPEATAAPKELITAAPPPVTEDPSSGKKGRKDRPERGVETMFRISSANHQRLSDMADNKANLLITVNAIILSAILSLLLRRLEDYYYLSIPTVIILTVSVLTVVYAILATRPSIPGGTFTPEDLTARRVNLLFFGNFYKMGYEDFAGGMEAMMEDKEFLYGSLIRDLYSQGIVLGKKYRLLRIAYSIFMFGIVVAVIAFIIATLIHGKD